MLERVRCPKDDTVRVRGDPTRAQCGTLCVVAARTPLRCGPVWRAINCVFDAAWMCVQLQRSFILHGAKKRNTVHTKKKKYCTYYSILRLQEELFKELFK